MLPAGLLSIGAIYICIIGFKETHQFSIPCNESLATVRPVSSCPMDEISFEKAAQNMSCATINNNCVRFEYHCVLNDYLNGTVEVCAPSLWVTGHVCTKFDSKLKSIFKTEDISCKNSTPSCGFRYNSTTLYNYRSCYNLSNIAKIIGKKLTKLKTTAVPPSTRYVSREILKTTLPVFSTSKLPTVFDKGEDEDKIAGNVVGIVLGAIFGVCVIVAAIVVGSLVLCLKHKWRTQRRKRLPVIYTELAPPNEKEHKDGQHIGDKCGECVEMDGSNENTPLIKENRDKQEKTECYITGTLTKDMVANSVHTTPERKVNNDHNTPRNTEETEMETSETEMIEDDGIDAPNEVKKQTVDIQNSADATADCQGNTQNMIQMENEKLPKKISDTSSSPYQMMSNEQEGKEKIQIIVHESGTHAKDMVATSIDTTTEREVNNEHNTPQNTEETEIETSETEMKEDDGIDAPNEVKKQTVDSQNSNCATAENTKNMIQMESEKLPMKISDTSSSQYQMMSNEQEGNKEKQKTVHESDSGNSAKRKGRRHVLEPRGTKNYPGIKPDYQGYKYDDGKKVGKTPSMSIHKRLDELEQKIDSKLSEERREREKLELRIRALEENIEKEQSEKEFLKEMINELQLENKDLKHENTVLKIKDKDKEKKIKELQKKLKEKDKHLDYLNKELHKLQKKTEQISEKPCRTRHKSC